MLGEEQQEPLPPLDLTGSVVEVVVGGALGTLIRALILQATQNTGTWRVVTPRGLSHVAEAEQMLLSSWFLRVPFSLIAVNTVGVFVATWLLAGPFRGRSPDFKGRLLLVTGFLGGFTSYSSLFVDLAWMKQSSWIAAAVTLVGAMALGIGSATMGLKVARR